MTNDLSQHELNEIELRIIRAERARQSNVTIPTSEARDIYDMAIRPNTDAVTDRLQNELDERNQRLAACEDECESLVKAIKARG